MPDYLNAAKKARTQEQRVRFTRLHREQKLREKIGGCTSCHLSDQQTPSMFIGSSEAKLIVLNETPQRDITKLREGMNQAGWSAPNDVAYVSLLCCATSTINSSLVFACEPNRLAQLNLIQAKIGIVTSLDAYRILSGDTKSTMDQVAGIAFWADGRVWIPTNKMQLGTTLKLAMMIYRGDVGWPPLPVEAFTLAGRSLTKSMKKGGRGYDVVYMPTLQDTIVVVRNEGVRVPSTVRREGAIYTLEELVKVGRGLKAMGRQVSDEDFRRMHLVKTVLGGTIVA